MNSRTGIVALLLATTTLMAQAPSSIPKALVTALEKYRCREIVDNSAFQNFDLNGRWWASLQQFTGSESDFAFYCHDKTDYLATRFIVESSGDKSPWKACRSTIEEWRGLVRPELGGSLEVVAASSLDSRITDLGRWWLADDSRRTNFKYGPKGTKVPRLILDTIGDGSGSLYACHNQQWYTITLD